MPVVLDPTPGGASANSLATLPQASTYHAGALYGAAWDDLDLDTQTRALITATRLIVDTVGDDWAGWPTSPTQALPLPRTGLRSRSGAALSSTEIPLAAAEATADLALRLVTAEALPDAPPDVPAGIAKFVAGPIEFTFDGSGASDQVAWLPDRVWQLLGFLLTRRSGRTCVPLERV